MTVRTAFEFSRTHHALVDFGDLHFHPGCAKHLLVAHLGVVAPWLLQESETATTAVLLSGTVHVDRPAPRWLTGIESQVVDLRGRPTNERLLFDLTDDQLIALERLRGDDGIELRLDMQATLLDPPEGVHPVRHVQCSLPISRGRWLELLEQAGTEVGVLLRVPSPLTHTASFEADASSPSLARAVQRLREARASLLDGAWEECVSTCRKVLDNLAKLVDIPPAKEVFAVSQSRKRTQVQRWAAIYYDVHNLASGAHHDDGEDSVVSTWNRADAEAVLASTAGLLTRYMASPSARTAPDSSADNTSSLPSS